MRTIAIIPARGGSKGVKNKNVRLICGKPLVQYAIEAALEAKEISEIWVSSDDERILKIASCYDGVNLHNRPVEIAGDNSPVAETIAEIIKVSNSHSDMIVLLQPTAPIRTGGQIDLAIQMLINNEKANSVISVCEMRDIHPARMYHIEDFLTPLMPDIEEKRRQDLDPLYFRNGAIYVFRTQEFLRTGKIMIKPSLGLIMPAASLLNIDEERDMIIAESLIKAWKENRLF